MTSTMRDKLGSGCMLLFVLPFAAVGVGAVGLIAWTLMTWMSMQSWKETPAHIEKAELVVNRSSDSATYNVKAQYAYEWNGKTFRGDRVSIHTSNDNIGSFHQRTYEELETHRSRNEPFRCYVNPKDPSQAVLYRDMRIELLAFMMLFALTFGAAGFGLMGGALYAGRLHRETAALRRQYPDAPWRWKKPWNDGVVHSGKKGKMMGIIVFAFFWNVISMPVMFFVPGELRQGNTLA
ncbi:MAG TPA: DUF3592 domain-containing protein, partial [Candidatus Hydrogenedentes bacterium]|nr:DUF3592 domain-containing protein [Candidatus Hydrogenedentota bacterium]